MTPCRPKLLPPVSQISGTTWYNIVRSKIFITKDIPKCVGNVLVVRGGRCPSEIGVQLCTRKIYKSTVYLCTVGIF